MDPNQTQDDATGLHAGGRPVEADGRGPLEWGEDRHEQAAHPTGPVRRHHPCTGCGYDLHGLAANGVCPECGRAVMDSLRGDWLRYCSPEYVRSLASGVSLVLNAVLCSVVLWVGQIFVAWALRTVWPNIYGVDLLVAFLWLGVAAMSLVGYWRYTTPDPAKSPRDEAGSARRVLRAAACGRAAARVAQTMATHFGPGMGAISFMPGAGSTGPGGAAAGGGAMGTALGVIWLVVWLVGVVAGVVQFFSVMIYTKWIARRMPDARARKLAGQYMWLLPVIAIPGALALFIGPLIALVLYWSLLDRVRKHLLWIIRGNEAARPAGAGKT